MVNSDIQRYKYNFMIFMLILTYTYMHYGLAGNYEYANFDLLTEFKARLPFAQRVLLPLIAAAIHKLGILDLKAIYFVLEFVFVGLLYWSLSVLLRDYFSQRHASFLSLLFIVLCNLIFVVNYRYTIGREAMINFPYDTPAFFFIAFGMRCVLQQKWLLFSISLLFATLNRESSILIVLLIPVLHWRVKTPWLKPLLINLALYLLIRAIIVYCLRDWPGVLMEWQYGQLDYTHFEVNLSWLFSNFNIVLLLAEFAFMPLIWFCFFDYIPLRFRDIRYIVFLYFILLMLVGNIFESRILGECAILMYLPICIAMQSWLGNKQPEPLGTMSVWRWIERYCILVSLLLLTLFSPVLIFVLRRLFL